MDQFLESGKIVNTHGIRGEVKIVALCDAPDFLCQFSKLYIDGKPYSVASARPDKTNVIVKFAGVNDINQAMLLKNKVVYIDRNQVTLPEGRYFLADLIGLEVRDADSGRVLGVLTEVMNLPASDVYVVQGEKTYLVPAVEEFLVETNLAEGYLRLRILEGMEQ